MTARRWRSRRARTSRNDRGYRRIRVGRRRRPWPGTREASTPALHELGPQQVAADEPGRDVVGGHGDPDRRDRLDVNVAEAGRRNQRAQGGRIRHRERRLHERGRIGRELRECELVEELRHRILRGRPRCRGAACRPGGARAASRRATALCRERTSGRTDTRRRRSRVVGEQRAPGIGRLPCQARIGRPSLARASIIGALRSVATSSPSAGKSSSK